MPKKKTKPEVIVEGEDLKKLKEVEAASQEVSLEEAYNRGKQMALNEALAEQAGYVLARTQLTNWRVHSRIKSVRAIDVNVVEGKVPEILEGGVPDEGDPLEKLPNPVLPFSTEPSLFL